MEPLISKFSRRVSGVATRFNNWSRPVELHSRFGFPGLLRVAQQSRRLIAREDVGLSRLHTIIPNPDGSGCAEIARYSPGSTQVSPPRDDRSRYPCPLLSVVSSKLLLVDDRKLITSFCKLKEVFNTNSRGYIDIFLWDISLEDWFLNGERSWFRCIISFWMY